MRSFWTVFAILTVLLGGQTVGGQEDVAPAPDKSRYTIFHPTPMKEWRAFNADRPTRADSPFTVDAGAFMLETDFVNFTQDQHNLDHARVTVRTLTAGQTNVKIGLTNWLDVEIFTPGYVQVHTSGADAGPSQTVRGVSDTTVRFKFNFIGNDGGKFALGLIAGVKIPTNSAQLGNRAYEPGIGVPFNYNLPAGFSLFGGTAINVIKLDDRSGRRVLWNNTLGVTRTIVGNLSGYLESYAGFSSVRGYPWIGTANVGLVYLVTPNFAVDVSTFFGLTRSADDLNLFTGFAWRF